MWDKMLLLINLMIRMRNPFRSINEDFFAGIASWEGKMLLVINVSSERSKMCHAINNSLGSNSTRMPLVDT